MAEIELTQGQVALIDDEDYERVVQFKWCASWQEHTKSFCAVRVDKAKRSILMHRFIMNAQPGQLIDHRHHNTLDNRKEQLRICNESQNHSNTRKRIDNTSGLIGVHLFKRTQRWQAQIRYEGRKIHIGCFADKIQAAIERDKKAKELHGEFAYLNFPNL